MQQKKWPLLANSQDLVQNKREKSAFQKEKIGKTYNRDFRQQQYQWPNS
jgi:hypothetical protein